ncbi:MAG: hypothetical protein LUK37_12860, partial [Clostridia bacterium]|nr:hypothetical protein [Clostridia bacterium]
MDASNELAIFHSGYDLNSSEDKQKGDRNARLILMELEEHPDDYDMMGYLGDAYYSIRDNNERAEEWYRKSIDRMPAHIDEYDVRNAVTFWKLMTILYKKNDEQAMMEIYEKAIRLIPKECDYDYIAGKFYVAKQDFKKGAYHLARALQILEKHGSINRGGGKFAPATARGHGNFLPGAIYSTEPLRKALSAVMPCVKQTVAAVQ